MLLRLQRSCAVYFLLLRVAAGGNSWPCPPALPARVAARFGPQHRPQRPTMPVDSTCLHLLLKQRCPTLCLGLRRSMTPCFLPACRKFLRMFEALRQKLVPWHRSRICLWHPQMSPAQHSKTKLKCAGPSNSCLLHWHLHCYHVKTLRHGNDSLCCRLSPHFLKVWPNLASGPDP